MTHPQLAPHSADAIPVHLTTRAGWPGLRTTLASIERKFAEASRFEPAPGRHILLPAANGALSRVIFALDEPGAPGHDGFLAGKLAGLLPAGLYRFADETGDLSDAALAFLLASYRFDRYRRPGASIARLCVPAGVDGARLNMLANAMAMGRDLVNTPANDLGPEALEQAIVALAKQHTARVDVVRGDDLLARNFPLIHAVGRAAAQPPRIVDFHWGARRRGPAITLVGKGVCFDTGGLNIKPDAGMLLMKKDMGGAASALALAAMIMGANLPVRLRVIVPIVENAISADAFRPGDIYRSRKGLSVEIGNTDAEGRLILADALALADEDAPDLIVDFATLTGAARVALGPDLPPFFTSDEALAAAIGASSMRVHDPVWRLPLWPRYDGFLDGKISDLNNISGNAFAGSIIAALFLKRFVEKARAYVHFDVYGWNPSTRPGRPEGGEVHAARAMFDLIEHHAAAIGAGAKS